MAWRRGQACGQDLWDRVLACPDLTLVEVATRFSISPWFGLLLQGTESAQTGQRCSLSSPTTESPPNDRDGPG